MQTRFIVTVTAQFIVPVLLFLLLFLCYRSFYCSFSCSCVIVPFTIILMSFLSALYALSCVRCGSLMLLKITYLLTTWTTTWVYYIAACIMSLQFPYFCVIFVEQMRNEATAGGVAPARESIWQYFVNKCANNLHVVLAMSPVGDTLRTRCRNFPGQSQTKNHNPTLQIQWKIQVNIFWMLTWFWRVRGLCREHQAPEQYKLLINSNSNNFWRSV